MLKYSAVLLAFSVIVQGVKKPSGTVRVYPASSESLDTSELFDPAPVRVWSASSDSADIRRHRTDFSNWTTIADGTTNMSCTGFLRYGDNKTFSAPIISTIDNGTCSLASVREYIWSEKPIAAPAACQCRPSLPMILAREVNQKRLCFGAPTAENGWGPFPGLGDCDTQPELVTPVYYHVGSGQIRSGGKCLTAAPYSDWNKSTDEYKPWVVKWYGCSNMANPNLRQSWDVADGVGIPLANLSLSIGNTTSLRPSGHRGRIALRDSGDIGQRCLDVSYEVSLITVLVRAVFLEAPLCDDARLSLPEKAIWRFFQVEGSPTAREMYDFKACTSPQCGDCGQDSELRVGVSNQAVSVPSDYTFNQVCNQDLLRRFVIPDMTEGKCYCQSHYFFRTDKQAAINDLSTPISMSSDDVPSRRRLSFPSLNSTSSSKK